MLSNGTYHIKMFCLDKHCSYCRLQKMQTSNYFMDLSSSALHGTRKLLKNLKGHFNPTASLDI